MIDIYIKGHDYAVILQKAQMSLNVNV